MILSLRNIQRNKYTNKCLLAGRQWWRSMRVDIVEERGVVIEIDAASSWAELLQATGENNPMMHLLLDKDVALMDVQHRSSCSTNEGVIAIGNLVHFA